MNPEQPNNATPASNPSREGFVPSSEWVAAGDTLADAVKALESRIGCGCGGDYGTCNYCERAAADAEKAADAWDELKKAATTSSPTAAHEDSRIHN